MSPARHGCVYVLTSPSGKQYVGKSIHPAEHRFARHLRAVQRGSKYAIHAAIRKYGWDAFHKEVIFTSDSETELLCIEQEQIQQRGSLIPAGYNMTHGGESGTPTESVRVLISQHAKAKWENPELRARMSRNMRGPRKKSEAYRTAAAERCSRPGAKEDFSLRMKRAWQSRRNSMLAARRLNAKIDAETVNTIRALRGRLSQGEIAALAGICQQQVSDIQTGKRWKQ